jgi:hypothetical protein
MSALDAQQGCYGTLRAAVRRQEWGNLMQLVRKRPCALALALLYAASAQSYEIEHVVANGGTHVAAGGTYILMGTIGQPVAGAASAGALRLDAGFWRPANALSNALFSDGFEGTP